MRGIFIIIFLSAHLLAAQKIVKKTVVNPDITAVQIDAKNCFELKIQTARTSEMLVEATIEGEYQSDLLLNLSEERSAISVNVGFAPNFKNPNDKLSTHKVVSIGLYITLPRFQNVQINGTSCNVIAAGAYENLKITLNDGSCTLNEVSKRVSALTQSGDINVSSSSAEISARSKFGKIRRSKIPTGASSFILTTTTGNINLSRNE